MSRRRGDALDQLPALFALPAAHQLAVAAALCLLFAVPCAAEPLPPSRLQGARRSKWNATGAWLDQEELYTEDPAFASAVARFLAREGAKRAIDVGSGSGDIARVVAREANMFVLGVDGNPTFVGRGDLSFPSGGRAEFRRVELDRPFPLDLGTFDWAMSFAVAEHVPFAYEHIFISNLHRASSKGLLLVWDQRDASGTGHVNCRDESEVLNLFTAIGFILDSEATAELRASAQLRWYKLAMVLRHGGKLGEEMSTVSQDGQMKTCPQSSSFETCWYQNVLNQRAIAELARDEHHRACWPPGWSHLKAKCCKDGNLMAPEMDDAAPSSCFGAGFSFQVCCSRMEDYYIF